MATTERVVPGAPDPRTKRLGAVVALLAVALGVLGVLTRLTDPTPWRTVGNDLAQDYLSARAMADGRSPYAPTGELLQTYLPDLAAEYGPTLPNARTPHPPTMIVAHRPFAGMPFGGLRVGYLLFMAVCIALAVGLTARVAGLPAWVAAVVGVASLGVPVAQKDLIWVQSHGLLLLLLVAGWTALRAGRDGLSGIALGLAAALKLFPAFMLLPLLRMRRYRAAGSMVGSAVLATLMGVLAVGWSDTWLFVSEVAPENLDDWRAAPMNVSLTAIPYRWLTRTIWRDSSIDLVELASVLSALALVACVWMALRTRAGVSGDLYWEAVPWMLLASPIAWDNYLVLALPLAVLVFAPLAVARRLPHPVVALAIGLMVIGAPAGLPSAPEASDLQQVLGFSLPMYGLLAFGIWSARGRVAVRAS